MPRGCFKYYAVSGQSYSERSTCIAFTSREKVKSLIRLNQGQPRCCGVAVGVAVRKDYVISCKCFSQNLKLRGINVSVLSLIT